MLEPHEKRRRRYFISQFNVKAADVGNDKKRTNSITPEREEDTKLRKEIHQFIIQQRTQVKSRRELLQLLIDTFFDEKYHKYQKHFENWVKDAIKEDEGR